MSASFDDAGGDAVDGLDPRGCGVADDGHEFDAALAGFMAGGAGGEGDGGDGRVDVVGEDACHPPDVRHAAGAVQKNVHFGGAVAAGG